MGLCGRSPPSPAFDAFACRHSTCALLCLPGVRQRRRERRRAACGSLAACRMRPARLRARATHSSVRDSALLQHPHPLERSVSAARTDCHFPCCRFPASAARDRPRHQDRTKRPAARVATHVMAVVAVAAPRSGARWCAPTLQVCASDNGSASPRGTFAASHRTMAVPALRPRR